MNLDSVLHVVRDLLNRELETNQSLIDQTKQLSGKKIVIYLPDLFPVVVSLVLEIGLDGFIKSIVLRNETLNVRDDELKITLTKKFVRNRIRSIASGFLSSEDFSLDGQSMFGQGLKIEGDVDDIQIMADIVSIFVDRLIENFSKVKSAKNELAKGLGWVLRGDKVSREEFEEQGRNLNDVVDRVESLEKNISTSR